MGNAFTGQANFRMPAAGDYGWHDEWWDNHYIKDVALGALNSQNRLIYGGVVTDGGALTADIAECRIYIAGKYFDVSAATAVALTAPPPENDEQKNWIYLDDTGALFVSTTAPTGDYVPLALVDVSDAAVLRIADLRPQGYGDPEVLSAIDKVLSGISGTVARVFRYDPSKDSDRGAWREFCSHLPWFNEELNTATRGRTRKFPADSLIVALTDQAIIFDLTKSDCPMWYVLNASATGFESILSWDGVDISSIAMLNGVLSVAKNGDNASWSSLHRVSFVNETAKIYASSMATNSRRWIGAFAGGEYVSDPSVLLIVAEGCNDVAMTIIDDAPIDPETGIAVPTIAGFTDGGVSVIDGPAGVETVASITGISVGTGGITGDRLHFGLNSAVNILVGRIPDADVTYTTYRSEPTTTYMYEGSIPSTLGTGVENKSNSFADFISGNALGLTRLYEKTTDPEKGMVDHTTYKSFSGIMQGDIRLAALADSVAGDIGNIFPEGSFDDTLDWTLADGYSVSGGKLEWVAGTGKDAESIASGLVIGKKYTFSFTVEANSEGSLGFGFYSIDTDTTTAVYNTGLGTFSYDFIPNVTNPALRIRNSAIIGTATIDNATVREAIEDRSVKNNPLQVVGTITKSPVATGAELQAFSGFSETDYIEQPYNSDLDFGVGDFYIMGWVEKGNSVLEYPLYLMREDATGDYIRMFIDDTLHTRATGSVQIDGSVDMSLTGYNFISLVRKDGVLYQKVNTVLEGSIANTNSFDADDRVLFLGTDVNHSSSLSSGSMALWRIGAGAPTDEQILEIYNEEKHLFQENAKCTLQGDSSNVKALYHDKDQNLLYAGTGDGATVFKGLLAIDHLQDGLDVVSLAGGKGAHFIASASAVNAYVPATDLREELARLSEQTKAYGGPLEDFWFTGDASETDFPIPHGWKPKHVYDTGLIKRPNSDYSHPFNGYQYTVSFTAAPGSGSDVCVLAQREV